MPRRDRSPDPRLRWSDPSLSGAAKPEALADYRYFDQLPEGLRTALRDHPTQNLAARYAWEQLQNGASEAYLIQKLKQIG